MKILVFLEINVTAPCHLIYLCRVIVLLQPTIRWKFELVYRYLYRSYTVCSLRNHAFPRFVFTIFSQYLKGRACDLEIKRKWNSSRKAAKSISLIIGTFKVAKFNTWPVVLLREKLIYVNETLVYSGIRNLRRFIWISSTTNNCLIRI